MGIVLVLAMVMGQSVISVRAGVVNNCDGAVFIDGQPVAKKFGTFPSLKEGSDLYTQEGRAELQLGPNIFLRLGTNSAVHMVSSSLSDTQVRLLNGSAIFDSGNAPSPGSVILLAGDAKIHIDTPSRMRLDADPPQLRVEKGEAKVERPDGATPIRADQMMPLTGDSVVRRMTPGSDDELDLWSLERNQAIYLSLSTSQGLLDPATDPDPTAPADLSAYLGYIPYYPGIQPALGPSYSTVYSSLYAYYPYSYAVPRYWPTAYGYRPTYGVTGLSTYRPLYSSPIQVRGGGIMFTPRPPTTILRPGTPARPIVAHPIGHK